MTKTNQAAAGAMLLAFVLALPDVSTANDFAIESFSRNGEITWTDTNTNGHYRVEWSPSLMTSNWLADWSHLTQIPATGGVITAEVPMFYRVVHVPPQTFAGEIEFLLVAGGGQLGGPQYDFYMSKTEITEIQFLTFLNDAEANPSTLRGTNMYFDISGNVYMDANMTSTELLFDISDSELLYNQSLSPGSRYSAFLDRTNHPVTGATCYGAMKYCNWLTIVNGRGSAARCFAEGTDPTDWHPANITYAAWADGFDNAERQGLVDDLSGFRLPMDDYATTASYFNEFYKAAAWHGTSNVLYGCGRSTIDGADANYRSSGDPYEALVVQTTPVGYFDGSNQGGAFQTRASANHYGIHDLCGNVFEWTLDYASSGGNATYGITRSGAWVMGAGTDLRAEHRDTYRRSASGSGSGPLKRYDATHNIGIRVVTTSP